MLIQTLGEVGRNPGGDEVLKPVRLCFAQRAADVIRGYPDFSDFAVVQQGFEPAVRDRHGLVALHVLADKTLEQKDSEHCCNYVPEVGLGLLVHGLSRSLYLGSAPEGSGRVEPLTMASWNRAQFAIGRWSMRAAKVRDLRCHFHRLPPGFVCIFLAPNRTEF